MTNATHRKYLNLYTFNRNKNDLFDRWLNDKYKITIHTDAWNYGDETFINLATGEEEYSEAKIMQLYVKAKMPYFKDPSDWYSWLDSDYKTIEDYFANR